MDVEQDLVQKDTIKASMKWTSASKQKMPYEHSRPLPRVTAQKALDYIAVLTRKYPVHTRYMMALPLWYRFTETWCDTGDEQESLRVI